MADSGDGSQRLRKQVLQRLESLERAGVLDLPKAKRSLQAPLAAPPQPLPASPILAPLAIADRPAAAARSAAPPSMPAKRPEAAVALPPPALLSDGHPPVVARPALSPPERVAALEVLQSEVAACTRCKVLAQQRTQTVFGVGNPQARLCFFGEAPGADEDRLGEPFVGRAGQLLTKIIEACTLKREDVYILNVLKCRPPENRPPEPDEVTNCRPFYERQLEIIRPEFICCLGATAARALLQTETSIGKLRGRFFNYRGSEVICTYHPSYLLRNPAAKRDVWDDMKVLMQRMGIELG